MGRVGQDFMDLAKPGLIKQYCMPNAIFTFKEYLEDFALPETKAKGLDVIQKLVKDVNNKNLKEKISKNLETIGDGERDIYF
jgi:2-iminoacetate synthase